MAFDIYAGGFARFYAREWETVGQKHARETGMKFQVIRPSDDPGPAKWEEAQEIIGHWKAAIVSVLRENAPAELDWREDRAAPYFTDRPGWDGYSALVLMAACQATNTPLPEKLPKDALTSDVVVRSYAAAFKGAFLAITQAQLWLPGAFDFSFEFVNPCHQKMRISSVRRLNSELRALRTAQGITDEELAIALRGEHEDSAPLKTIAIFGLSVFSQIAEQALTNRLPLMLSF